MSVYPRLVAAIGLSCLVTHTAQAQDNQPKIGTDPLLTEKAPNTTAAGQTKPPSRDASPTSVKDIDQTTPRQAVDDAIATRVCTGCNPVPATTGALPDRSPADQSVERLGAKLDELRTTAPPQQQSDLNTTVLASAHRERAKSMEEKTDGLWQSWLVSVCEGCGDQKPVKAMRYEEWPDRKILPTAGTTKKSLAQKAKPTDKHIETVGAHNTLEANLSPENIDSIRRSPQH